MSPEPLNNVFTGGGPNQPSRFVPPAEVATAETPFQNARCIASMP